ncbi:MAG: transporter substrate-binding domain-containing protein, partial [Desulfobacteraceae bacterium]|nr:transporter substrate-binding domain-containing protein [Desulfobacteraceae bacterium]
MEAARRLTVLLCAAVFCLLGACFFLTGPAWAASAPGGGHEAGGQPPAGETAASQRASMPEPGLTSLTPEERAWLRAHPVISVGVDPGWPPIEFRDDTGKCAGLSMDYLDLVQEKLGVKFEKVCNSNWSETVSRLKRWEIDMTVAVAVTSERME